MVETVADRRAELIEHYQQAKSWLSSSRYVREIEWQRAATILEISESIFLREYAWVVLNCGFRETVVRKHFDYISLCFCDWESLRLITEHADVCVASASLVFRNQRKLQSIVIAARTVSEIGFDGFRLSLTKDPIPTLRNLPFMGEVTATHLAKNLGADVAKPDRHLMRLARRFGYQDVTRMCQDIADEVGDRIGVADIILWRFEERSNYLRAST